MSIYGQELPAVPLATRASTAELVADTVRAWITDGLLRPGTRLPEAAICENLGVSRNTLREAFRLLGHERLVVHELNRGVFVRRLAAEDVMDLFRVREIVELAGVRSWPQAGAGFRNRISGAVAAGRAAASARDWPAVATADLDFHRAIAALAGSHRIDEMMKQVLAELRLAFAAVADAAAFHQPFLDRNAAIADMLFADRSEDAAAALSAYLHDACGHVVAAMGRQH